MVRWRFRIPSHKEKRFYTYSLTLSIEQINWLRSKADAPALVRKLFDDAMIAESAEDFVKLKEELKKAHNEDKKLSEILSLLQFKRDTLKDHPRDGKVNENEVEELNAEIETVVSEEQEAEHRVRKAYAAAMRKRDQLKAHGIEAELGDQEDDYYEGLDYDEDDNKD